MVPLLCFPVLLDDHIYILFYLKCIFLFYFVLRVYKFDRKKDRFETSIRRHYQQKVKHKFWEKEYGQNNILEQGKLSNFINSLPTSFLVLNNLK